MFQYREWGGLIPATAPQIGISKGLAKWIWESSKVFVLHKVTYSNSTYAKQSKPWGNWRVCLDVNFRVLELAELRANRP